MTYREDLTQATLKVYERYAVEVVERFGFCPWARSAREHGRVHLDVIFSVNKDDFDESVARLLDLHEGNSDVDIALFIYPLLDLERLPFEAFVRQLRSASEMHRPRLDEFALAAFHPSANADLGDPDRLVPYVRRTPDPTLQLVRKTALSAIKGLSGGTAFVDLSRLSMAALEALSADAPKPVRERIAEQNFATVCEVGTGTIDAVVEDILRDREAAHRALLARYGKRGPCRCDVG